MRNDPSPRFQSDMCLSLVGGYSTPEFTGRILRFEDLCMIVSLDSAVPPGALFQAEAGEENLFGEVVSCSPLTDRFEATLRIHSRTAPSGLPPDAARVESVLPSLLAMNARLLEASAPAERPEPRGSRSQA